MIIAIETEHVHLYGRAHDCGLIEALDSLEKYLIEHSLAAANYDRAVAARILGIHQISINRRLAALDRRAKRRGAWKQEVLIE